MSNAVILRSTFFVLLCVAIIYLLSPILTPFFLGTLLAYLGNPVVSYLNSKHIPRTFGVILVFLIVIFVLVAVIVVLAPMVQEQIFLAIQKIPVMLLWFQDSILSWLNRHTSMNMNDYLNVASVKKELAQHSQKIGNLVTILIKGMTHSTFAMINFVMNLILVPVVAFYLMRDWPIVIRNIQAILPASSRKNISHLALQCDEVVGSFFKGQLLVMLGLAIIYSTGLWLVGLQVALFVGLLCGCLAIVPYLGLTVGIIVASVAMYLETHSMIPVTYVWGVFTIGQMAESMLLTPLLVGHRIGLHPVAVIFAVLTGGLLFGFLGVLLALPVAAVVLVILKHTIANGDKRAISA